MLVETKAITELGLHLGRTWFVIDATIILVLVMAFLANLMVQGKVFGGRACHVGLMASLPWIFLCPQPRPGHLGSPQADMAVSCELLTLPLFFSGIVFSSLDRQSRRQHLHRACLQSDGGSVWRVDGIQLDVFRISFLYLLAMGFYFLAWMFSWDPAAVWTRRRLGFTQGSVP